MDYTLDALNQAAVALGKAVVMYSVDGSGDPIEWDGATDLLLAHLGDTEGDVVFTANERISGRRLREWFGEAYVRAYVSSADPVATIPLFLAHPDLRDLISPTGDGKIGTVARREVVRHTLVMFPQQLYFNAVTNNYDATIRYTTAAGWQKSAVAEGEAASFAALSADDTRLLGLSIWIPAGFWERPPVTYRVTRPGDDEVLDIETATFHAVVPFTARENIASLPMAWIGSPLAHGIAIDVT